MARALRSKRQKKIDAMTGPGVRIDALAASRIASNDLEPVYDHKGTVTEVRRRSNVFRILRDTKVISQNQSAYGTKLVEIYAKWRGLYGAPDDSELGWCNAEGNRSGDLVNDMMIEAGKQWREIMAFVGPSSNRLLTALCKDILEGDGNFIMEGATGKPKVRWRHVVETVNGEKDRNRQSVYVQLACVDLEKYWS